jgi:hypothetical protein
MSLKNRRGQRGVTALVAAAIITAAMLVLVSAMALQVRSLDMSERYAIPWEQGVEAIDLNVAAALGEVDVSFADLQGDAAVITTRLSGSASMLGGENLLSMNVTYEHDRGTGVLNVTAIMDVYAPWPYHSLDQVRCEVQIDRGLAADINISVVTGGAIVRTAEGTNITGMSIDATSLGSVVALNNGTVLSGDVSIRTATGGGTLYWNNVVVDGDRTLSMEESSGQLRTVIVQDGGMGGTVTLLKKSVGGPIALDMELSGDVSGTVGASRDDARFNCSEGFRCHDGAMTSIRPAESSFDVRMESAGGIEARGRWTP